MKNSKGLKGTTDALSHCKSMYGKGGSAGTNQMIRSMKSYQMGGATDCAANPDQPNCKKKYGKRGLSTGQKKGIGAGIAGVAAMVANKKYGLVDKIKEAVKG